MTHLDWLACEYLGIACHPELRRLLAEPGACFRWSFGVDLPMRRVWVTRQMNDPFNAPARRRVRR